MANINLGRIGMVLKGQWNGTFTYNRLDVVSHNGGSYTSIVDNNTGKEPPNSAYWQISADKGAKGDKGDQGEKGDPGEVTQAQLDAVHNDLTSHKNDYTTQVGTVANLTTTSKVVVGGINELNTNKANKVQEAWITPTLLNGATAFAGSVIGYMKDNFGFVHLKGRLIRSTTGIVFNLPAGYRPPQPITFASGAYLGSNYSVAPTGVSLGGDVFIYSASSDPSKYIDMSNIIFKAGA